jgi:hypothetical protein
LRGPHRGAISVFSNTANIRSVCFLGRFLPKLGGTQVPPFFLIHQEIMVAMGAVHFGAAIHYTRA